MSTYCGIDLHSNSSVISIIDETDRVIKEKRLDNNLAIIQEFLQPCQNDIDGIVVESTYNWCWLVYGLWFMEQGIPCTLFNSLAIQQYNGIKYTNDQPMRITATRYFTHWLYLPKTNASRTRCIASPTIIS
jgi:hypothetical protein